MIDWTHVLSFLVGIVAALVAAYRFLAARISPEEATAIYNKAKEAIDAYNKAMENGSLTTEEKLEIAEKTIAALHEVIKALKE